MNVWHNEWTDTLCEALLSLETKEQCCAFLDDVCTIKEIQDLSQRLAVAGMLFDGKSYTDIIKQTGASTATISRVNKCLTYGSGGYQSVLSHIKPEESHD